MRIIFVLLLALSVAHAVDAGNTNSPSVVAQHFLDAKFERIDRMKSIPASVVNALSNLVQDGGLRFADPGQRFNSTDVVEHGNLPWRRLVFAGKSGKGWFVCYEKGGYAFHYCIVLIEDSGETGFPIWGGVFFDKVHDDEELRGLLRKGKMIEIDLKKPQGNF